MTLLSMTVAPCLSNLLPCYLQPYLVSLGLDAIIICDAVTLLN